MATRTESIRPNRGPGTWSVRTPLNRRSTVAGGVLAFVIPFALWCVVSYVPFIWHPLVLVQYASDSDVPGAHNYLAVGQRVEHAEFVLRNAELRAAKKPLARGTPANPIYFQAPHEVGHALLAAFSTPPERDGDL